MLAPLPPDHAQVELVGFTKNDNGCECANHPGGCGVVVLVWAAPDCGVGLVLRLRLTAPNCGFAHGEILDEAQLGTFLIGLHQQYRQQLVEMEE